MPYDDMPFPRGMAADPPGAAAGPAATAPETLAATLLSGRSAARAARAAGTTVADSYHVLAVDLAHPAVVAGEPPATTHGPPPGPAAGLAALISPEALTHRSQRGVTLLVPTAARSGDDLDTALTRTAPALGKPVVAVLAEAAPAGIPQAAEYAWEVMEVARRLRLPAGLYRLDDLALEYQLTRPGPGRDQLGSLLDPLDEHPELTRTLRTHITGNLNRQRTARVLHIHPNTVDYRLKRIGELTGLDPTDAPGLWHLRSALVVRGYTADGE